MRRFLKLRAGSGLFAAVILVMGAAAASAQVGTAALYGDVTDPQQQAAPGATVTLTRVETGRTQTSTSDERGTYRFVGLEPGTYVIKVALDGFKTTVADNVQ